MSFALTPASPFTPLVSVVPATVLNDWRVYISRSLDTVNGGSYTNVSTIDWLAGGAGWRFYAVFAIKSTGSLIIDAGATVLINATSTINADIDLTAILRCQSGGGFRVYSGASAQFDSGSTTTCNGTTTHGNGSSSTFAAGSTLAINTALATLGAGAVLTVNGVLGNVAQVIFGQYSTCAVSSGSGLTCASGSLFTLGSGCTVTATIGGGGATGSLTFGADGSLTVPTTCTTSLSLGADATLVVTAGAAVTMSVGGGGTPGSITINADGTLTTSASSEFNNGGTTTRTGAEILSGATAYTALRIEPGPDSATANIDGRAQDILEVDMLSAPSVYTLTNLSATETCRFKIRVSTTTTLSIARADTTVIVAFALGAGDARTVEVYWNGSTWKVLDIGSVFADL